jgi:hypothetical protein
MLRLYGGMPSAIFRSSLSGKHFKTCSKFLAKDSQNREHEHEMAAAWAYDAIRDLARLCESRVWEGIYEINAINRHYQSLGGSTT